VAADRQSFSVVIPLYNKQAEIARTLASVVAQTHPPAEIIVVNDGSTDGSRSEVEAFAHPDVRIVDQSNQGECAARNTGIRSARHDWIAFLDADDEWLPGHLASLAALIRDFPEARACSDGFIVESPNGRRLPPTRGVPNDTWRGIIPDFFNSNLLVFSSGVAIHRDVFPAAGFFQPRVAYGGDYDMWLRLASYFPIAHTTEIGAIYHTDASNRVSRRPAMRRTLFLRRSLRQVDAEPGIPAQTKKAMRRRVAAYELKSAHWAHRRGYWRQARRLATVWEHEFGRTRDWWLLRLKLLVSPQWAQAWARLRGLPEN